MGDRQAVIALVREVCAAGARLEAACGVLGLLALGKSDFEAIEAFRNDRFFRQALQIGANTR